MLVWWICTHCSHGHFRWFCIDMTPMRHRRVLYVSNRRLYNSTDLWFWLFWLRSFSLFNWISLHASNDQCILLSDMQHSQPRMILYHSDAFLIWGWIIIHSVWSLMLILLPAYIASLSPLSSGVITMRLWSLRTGTWSNNSVTNFGS